MSHISRISGTSHNAISLRTVLSSLALLLVTPLIGCLSSPKHSLSDLTNKNIVLVEPRHERVLKLQRPEWSQFASAATLRREENQINNALGTWGMSIAGRFLGSLAATLRKGGLAVVLEPQEEYGALIRSHLTAGFVFKTPMSNTYVPFVQVSLGAFLPNGARPYYQLYVATDRPFHFLMASIPAYTPYVFSEIESLRTEREKALDALGVLAAQLGQQFGAELIA